MSGGFGNPGPPGDAAATEAVETLASTVASDGEPDPGQPVVAIRDAAPLPTFTAAPGVGVDTEAFYIAGAGPQQNDRGGNLRYVIIEPSAEAIDASTGYVAENFPEIIDNRIPVANRTPITSFRPGFVENLDLFGFGGTGTHGIDVTTRSQEIAISGANGALQWWQSHTKFPLPTGMPFSAIGAVAFSDAGQPNQVRRIQIGDEFDYLGLEMSGTDVAVVGRSAITGASFSIPREAWLDPLDGTGQSTVTVDWSQFNTFQVISGVPGASIARAWINGVSIVNLAAPENFAGLLKNTEQPLRASIQNTGVSAPGFVRVRGFAIHSIGDFRPQVYPAPAPITTSTRTVDVTGLPVLSIRAKSTLGGQPWRGLLLPKTLDLAANGGRVAWRLIMNPSGLAGASWVSGGDAVGLEYDVSATAITPNTGRPLASGTLASTLDSVRVDLTAIFEEHMSHPIRNRVDGVSDVLVIYVAATLGTAAVTTSVLVDVIG